MFCYKCGCQLDDDSEFCYKCGAKLNDTVDVNSDNDLVQADYSEPDVVIVKKKSKLPVVIIILLLCIFIAVAVIVLIMLPKSGASKKYTDQIEIAENYFKDEDYERAIKAYEKAIEIDPNNKDAYIGLADVYLAMGEDEKAMEVLTSIDANLDDDSKKAIEDKISDVEDKTGLKSGNNSKKSDSKEKNKGEANKVSFSADAYNANTSVDGYYEAVSDVTVSLCPGFDNEGKASYSATTDENGSAYFDSVEEGDYTVIYEKDGFITTKENVAISEGSSVNQYMIQYSANNDVIAIVEWSGNQDIDLCFFNASTKERISYGNPVDGSGSFIYSDNKDNHYEMVYLRDINKSDVRSLYVVDAIAASNGQSSSMESDGIKVSVYKGDNCLYEKYANSSHSENIWYPFYVYEGDVYDADEYHNADESGYDWALLSKTGAESDKADNLGLIEGNGTKVTESTFKIAYQGEVSIKSIKGVSHYYLADGTEITREEYQQILSQRRNHSQTDTTNTETVSENSATTENTDKTESATGNWKEAYINKLNSLNIIHEADFLDVTLEYEAEDMNYWLVDIESDNVPELVVSYSEFANGDTFSYLHIYKYIDGKVKDVSLNTSLVVETVDTVATDGKGKVFLKCTDDSSYLTMLVYCATEVFSYDLKDNKFINHQSENWWALPHNDGTEISSAEHYYNGNLIEKYDIDNDEIDYNYWTFSKVIIPTNGSVAKLSYSQLMNKLK